MTNTINELIDQIDKYVSSYVGATNTVPKLISITDTVFNIRTLNNILINDPEYVKYNLYLQSISEIVKQSGTVTEEIVVEEDPVG